jgi:hypothetical protein
MTKVMIFTPATLPRNFLEPVGDHTAWLTAFVSELRDFAQLMPQTYPLLWDIIDRMYRAVPPGGVYPSLEDLRRVLEHEAEVQHRENLYTAGRAIRNLCVILGEAATIRRPADLSLR